MKVLDISTSFKKSPSSLDLDAFVTTQVQIACFGNLGKDAIPSEAIKRTVCTEGRRVRLGNDDFPDAAPFQQPFGQVSYQARIDRGARLAVQEQAQVDLDDHPRICRNLDAVLQQIQQLVHFRPHLCVIVDILSSVRFLPVQLEMT